MKAPLASSLVGLALTVPTVALAGTVERSDAGGRPVRVFVPTTPAAKPAAVLMLHGCTQTADAFADATRMDAVAEENGFYAIYVEQPEASNAGRCWQWFDTKHQARGAGEPKALADAVAAVVAAKGVDAERVYVAGLSAGAAMSVVLGATYPDRFAAIGVVAGLPYKAATNLNDTYTVSQTGDVDANALGDAARAAMTDVARVVPTLVFHGTQDGIINVQNGRKVAEQWVRTNGLLLAGDTLAAPTTATATVGGYGTTTITHRTTSNNATVVELVVVDNLGHAWPGGLEGGSFSDTRGPDASRALWAFFAPRSKSAALPAGPPPGTSSSGSSGASSSGASGGTPEGESANGDGSSGGTDAASSDSGCKAMPARTSSGGAVLVLTALAGLVVAARRRRA